MGMINRSIPNLYNGISQQPPALRLPSQAEVQENAVSSVVDGLKKRPPTRHLAKINNNTYTDSFVHTINRDTSSQYVVVITNGDLFVYDLAGNAKTVSFPDGKGYLSATTPRTSFAAVTVADYTFIVNKTKVVAQAATTAGGTIKGSKQKFIDLPTSGNVNGDVWEIAGDNSNNFDNYYVQYQSSTGVWRETVKPGVKTNLDNTTMPFKLVDNGDGTFTFSKITWSARLVGDDDSATFPSFTGKTLSDVFFHRNRLGFLSDENVIFSRAGDFFNFFPETTTTILDTDPVDVAVSHNKVAVLRHALSYNTSLMLFADQAQFQLTAKDSLTPRTAAINVTTEFTIEASAKPVSAGSSLYFAITRGEFSGIKEYEVQPLTYNNDAADVTAHCPKYIPKNLFKLASSNLDDILVCLSTQERNALWVYKFYWATPDEKVQSSWSKFTFDPSDVILNADFIDTKLYLVIKRSDGTYIEYLDFAYDQFDADLGFLVHLDHRVSRTGSYNATTNETTWTMPYPVDSSFKAVLGGTFTLAEGSILSLSAPTAYTLKATGNYSTGSVYIGKPYTMTYQFSPIYYKDDAKVAVPHYNIQLKNVHLFYNNSGYFSIEVTPKNRETYTYKLAPILGDPLFKVGSITISKGKFRFPIFSNAETTSIKILSDSMLPCSLQGAEWEGLLTTRSKHI
jgi:hypothetical protein